MPRSPTPNSSFSGVMMPRTMFLSISSTRMTRPSTHIGSVKSRWNGPRRDGWSRSRCGSPMAGHSACTVPWSSPVGGPGPAGMLGPWTAPSPPSCSPGSCSWSPGRSSAAGPPTPRCAPATPCPSQVDPRRLRPPGGAVAGGGVHVGDLRQLRRACGSGRASSRATRWRSRRSRWWPARTSTTATASRPCRRRSWSTPTGWCSPQLPRPRHRHRPLGRRRRSPRARQHPRRLPRGRTRLWRLLGAWAR